MIFLTTILYLFKSVVPLLTHHLTHLLMARKLILLTWYHYSKILYLWFCDITFFCAKFVYVCIFSQSITMNKKIILCHKGDFLSFSCLPIIFFVWLSVSLFFCLSMFSLMNVCPFCFRTTLLHILKRIFSVAFNSRKIDFTELRRCRLGSSAQCKPSGAVQMYIYLFLFPSPLLSSLFIIYHSPFTRHLKWSGSSGSITKV